MDSLNPYATPEGGTLFHDPRRIGVPVTPADILRTATAIYFAHFLPMAAVMLVFWVPLEFGRAYVEYFVLGPEEIGRAVPLSLLIEFVIGAIPTAGVMAMGAAALKGERVTVLLGLAEGFEAWPRIFFTRVIVTAAIVLAAFALLVPAVYVAVKTILAEPAAVIEKRGGASAVVRAFELTRGSFWGMLVLLFIFFSYLVGLGLLLQVPTFFFDHWLLSAALSVCFDLLAGWTILLVVTAYWSQAHAPHNEDYR